MLTHVFSPREISQCWQVCFPSQTVTALSHQLNAIQWTICRLHWNDNYISPPFNCGNFLTLINNLTGVINWQFCINSLYPMPWEPLLKESQNQHIFLTHFTQLNVDTVSWQVPHHRQCHHLMNLNPVDPAQRPWSVPGHGQPLEPAPPLWSDFWHRESSSDVASSSHFSRSRAQTESLYINKWK